MGKRKKKENVQYCGKNNQCPQKFIVNDPYRCDSGQLLVRRHVYAMMVTMCYSSVEIVGNDSVIISSVIISSGSVWSRETEGEVNNPDQIQGGNTIDRRAP